MTIAARRELAHYIDAPLGRQSDACRGGATSGGQHSLCERASRCVSSQAPRGVRAFAVLRVARDRGAGQGMWQSRRDAVLGGAVVVQIFVQPRRYSVLHGSLHRLGRQPGAQALAGTGAAALPAPGQNLGLYSARRPIVEGGMGKARDTRLGRTDPPPKGAQRSEEHTSELQSLRHLVCRLLLEKKKHKTN